MHLSDTGTPIVQSSEDETRLAAFIDKLANNLYGRLPKFVRMFLSLEALKGLLASAAGQIASRV